MTNQSERATLTAKSQKSKKEDSNKKDLLTALPCDLVLDAEQESKKSGVRNFLPWSSMSEFVLVSVGATSCFCSSNAITYGIVKYGRFYILQYAIFLYVVLLPIYINETAIGQYSRMDVCNFWANICPILVGVSWLIILAQFFYYAYYIHFIAKALWYWMVSFSKAMASEYLPWISCDYYSTYTFSCIQCDLVSLKLRGQSLCELYSGNFDKLNMTEDSYRHFFRKEYQYLYQPAILYQYKSVYHIEPSIIGQLTMMTDECFKVAIKSDNYSDLHQHFINTTDCGTKIIASLPIIYSFKLFLTTGILVTVIIVSLMWGFSMHARVMKHFALLPIFILFTMTSDLWTTLTTASTPTMFGKLFKSPNVTLWDEFKLTFWDSGINSYLDVVSTAIDSLALGLSLIYQISQRLQYKTRPIKGIFVISTFNLVISIGFAALAVPAFNTHVNLYKPRGDLVGKRNKFGGIISLTQTMADHIMFNVVPTVLHTGDVSRTALMHFVFFTTVVINGATLLTVGIDSVRQPIQQKIDNFLIKTLSAERWLPKRILNFYVCNSDRVMLIILGIGIFSYSSLMFSNNHHHHRLEYTPNILPMAQVLILFLEVIVILAGFGLFKWANALRTMYPISTKHAKIARLFHPSSPLVLCIYMLSSLVFLGVFLQYFYISIKVEDKLVPDAYIVVGMILFGAICQIIVFFIKKKTFGALFVPTADFKQARQFILSNEEAQLFADELVKHKNTMQALYGNKRKITINEGVKVALKKCKETPPVAVEPSPTETKKDKNEKIKTS